MVKGLIYQLIIINLLKHCTIKSNSSTHVVLQWCVDVVLPEVDYVT